MSQRVYVLQYNHNHGTDIGVYASIAAAEAARGGIIMDNLNECFSEETKRAIETAFAAGEFDKCYDLYIDENPDESIYIEDLALKAADVTESCSIVDAETEIVHEVRTWPYAHEHGAAACGHLFSWTSRVAGRAYYPKEPRTVTCLSCIAAGPFL